ncbi:5'-adenylylsulfate reductase-like 4 [Mercurialis annua]|uniref:5'-adenylylsulfate reductase-like 4 n=1 Tax=Mercurialis annua TaxID=3986 RepID=UPI0024AF64EE|nr:5'-adenylylsulfate reductase-like 4 [Mercurialis annua]
MGARVWQRRIAMLLSLVIILLNTSISASAFDATTADLSRSISRSKEVLMCPRESLLDSIFPFLDQTCTASFDSSSFFGVTEICLVKWHNSKFCYLVKGDGVSLQKALNLVHKNSRTYVAVLFYAARCPFSRNFRPSFSLLSSFYPSVAHFAIEESSIRPSILSKYGVHGFPTLFILNSTMRERYQGSRNLGSLVAFYADVTGIKTESLNKAPLDKIVHQSNHEKHDNYDHESCPFSWARSPENLFRQETYLALATAFVLVRLIYLFFPTLLALAQFAWRRQICNLRMGSFLEHPRAYLNGIMQIFNSLKEPCKKRNL